MLDELLSDARRDGLSVTVYTPDLDPAVVDQVTIHGVAVEHRLLPPSTAPFVTIQDDDGFLGALPLADFEALLAPPVDPPGSRADVAASYQSLLSLLEDTAFTSLDRRQLLGTSREIEDRAFRVGHGTLRASFQSLSTFEAQTDVYRHLAVDTDLDIHVYGEADWTPPAIDGVTYHETTEDTVERFWVVAFDGGSERGQACALVARAEDEDYTGFWTYDPKTVDDVLAALETVDG
jgi:hypothetical protein